MPSNNLPILRSSVSYQNPKGRSESKAMEASYVEIIITNLNNTDAKESMLGIYLDEPVWKDIEKSQLEDCNEIQDKIFYNHQLVRQNTGSPNSCLAALYAGDKNEIAKNYDLPHCNLRSFISW